MNYLGVKQLTVQKTLFIVTTLALLSALILTILSLFEFCSSACIEGHKFKIFNLKFEYFGILFFSILLAVNLLGYKFNFYSNLTSLLVTVTAGAELYFIYIQKFITGVWCPICLSIAACILIAMIACYINYFISSKKTHKEGRVMRNLFKNGFTVFTALFLGFITAYMGVTKINANEEAIGSLKDSIAFGDPTSTVEIYIFTDWFCPACNKIEPVLKMTIPKIEKNTKIFFIDAFIHPESMNYTPYNLSFMIYNKPLYFDLREALLRLSTTTESPSELEVKTAIQSYDIPLKELNYKDIAIATKIFKSLKKQFNIASTPVIIIINTKTKKGKKLSGTAEISEAKILEAINTLKS